MLAIPRDYDPATAPDQLRVGGSGGFATLADAIRSLPEKLARAATITLPGDYAETIHDGAGGPYIYLRRGPAHDAPFAIVWDGTGSQRPRIRPAHATSLRFDQTPGGIPGNVLIRGLCFDDPAMDPANPSPTPPAFTKTVQSGWLSARTAGQMPVRLEYCEFRNNGMGAASGGAIDPETMHWFELHRCVFLRGWSYINVHGQGVQATGVRLRMSECVVAHGGWAVTPDGQPIYRADGQLNGTLFNHGCYFIDLLPGSEIVDNAYVDNCSVGIKVRSTANGKTQNLTIARNLVTGNEVGIGYAGQQNTGPIWPDRAFVDCVWEDNVVLLTPQRTGTPKTATGRNLAWGLGGGSMGRCVWRNNIVANGTPGRDNRTLTFEALRADGVPDVYDCQFLDNTGSNVNATSPANDYFRVNKLEPSNTIRHRPAVGSITTAEAMGGLTPQGYFDAVTALDQRNWASQWPALSPATINARVRAAVWGDTPPPPPPPPPPIIERIDPMKHRLTLPTPVAHYEIKAENGQSATLVNGTAVYPPGTSLVVEAVVEFPTEPVIEPVPTPLASQ
jgi:hypothetical protein